MVLLHLVEAIILAALVELLEILNGHVLSSCHAQKISHLLKRLFDLALLELLEEKLLDFAFELLLLPFLLEDLIRVLFDNDILVHQLLDKLLRVLVAVVNLVLANIDLLVDVPLPGMIVLIELDEPLLLFQILQRLCIFSPCVGPNHIILKFLIYPTFDIVDPLALFPFGAWTSLLIVHVLSSLQDGLFLLLPFDDVEFLHFLLGSHGAHSGSDCLEALFVRADVLCVRVLVPMVVNLLGCSK